MKKILTMFLVLFIFYFLIASQAGCKKSNTDEIKKIEDSGSSKDSDGSKDSDSSGDSGVSEDSGDSGGSGEESE